MYIHPKRERERENRRNRREFIFFKYMYKPLRLRIVVNLTERLIGCLGQRKGGTTWLRVQALRD